MVKPTKVAVVTGASRGAGRGIALALAETGATVYVTGRSVREGQSFLPGTIYATADEVTARGGKGIPVVCDHSDEESIERLFNQVQSDYGYLDVLVNNVFSVPEELTDKSPFWKLPSSFTHMFDVGLKSTYLASWHGAPLLTSDSGRDALLVNTSGFGGGCYMHGPAYGAVKAGVDKMAHDMAVDFAPYNVTAIALWMGLLRTERTQHVMGADPDRYGELSTNTESPEFPGRIIAVLAQHPDKKRWSGQTVVGAEIANELGVIDVDGRSPRSRRSALGDPIQYNDAVVH